MLYVISSNLQNIVFSWVSVLLSAHQYSRSDSALSEFDSETEALLWSHFNDLRLGFPLCGCWTRLSSQMSSDFTSGKDWMARRAHDTVILLTDQCKRFIFFKCFWIRWWLELTLGGSLDHWYSKILLQCKCFASCISIVKHYANSPNQARNRWPHQMSSLVKHLQNSNISIRWMIQGQLISPSLQLLKVQNIYFHNKKNSGLWLVSVKSGLDYCTASRDWILDVRLVFK